MPAHAAPNNVINSAMRLVELRQSEQSQIEQCRYKRAATGDSDPPDVIDKREAPHHRPVDAPDTDAGVEEIEDRAEQDRRQQTKRGNGNPPPKECTPTQRNPADVIGHVEVVGSRQHHRVEGTRNRRIAHTRPLPIVGLGLVILAS